MDNVLTDEQLEDKLATLNVGWSAIPGQGLVRVFETGSFKAGVTLLVRLAEVVAQFDHDPTIRLHSDQLEVTLTTLDAGGVTERDIELAGAIDKLE